MATPKLSPAITPALLGVLELAAERNVWADPTRETTRWMTKPRSCSAAVPVTVAVQCLLDAGLLADDRSGEAIGSWRLAVLTAAGRALLDTLNQPEGN